MKTQKHSRLDNRYTYSSTAYWLGEESYGFNLDELPKFKVNEKLVNACARQHLHEQLKHWEDNNIDLEDMIHQLESVIRRFEDVQENVVNGNSTWSRKIYK
tara:strand:- start:1012 stop:1314 length:303 start_codon:yes stop_codon:yes gene_type:complete